MEDLSTIMSLCEIENAWVWTMRLLKYLARTNPELLWVCSILFALRWCVRWVGSLCSYSNRCRRWLDYIICLVGDRSRGLVWKDAAPCSYFLCNHSLLSSIPSWRENRRFLVSSVPFFLADWDITMFFSGLSAAYTSSTLRPLGFGELRFQVLLFVAFGAEWKVYTLMMWRREPRRKPRPLVCRSETIYAFPQKMRARIYMVG